MKKLLLLLIIACILQTGCASRLIYTGSTGERPHVFVQSHKYEKQKKARWKHQDKKYRKYEKAH